MNQEYSRVFTSLVNLTLDVEKFKIEAGMYLTTDQKIKEQVALRSLKDIGGLEYSALMHTHPVLAYAFIGFAVTEENTPNTLYEVLYPLQVFCFCLWIVKDNSVYPQMCYLDYDTGVYSNLQAQFNSNCHGTTEEVCFNEREMGLAKVYYNKLKKHATSERMSSRTALTSNTNRISRFMIHLSAARLHHDIAFKYGFYFNALEALLVTNALKSENKRSSKVKPFIAIRIGLILNQNTNFVESRLNSPYEHRSTVFHGRAFQDSVIGNEKKILIGLNDMDGFCRQLFQRVLSDEKFERALLHDDAALDEYFDKLALREVS